MNFTLRWGGDPENLLVTMSGFMEVEDLEALQEALADARWRSAMRILLDERDVDWSRMSASDVERRAGFLARGVERLGGCRTAVVVSRDLDFGMVRGSRPRSSEGFPTSSRSSARSRTLAPGSGKRPTVDARPALYAKSPTSPVITIASRSTIAKRACGSQRTAAVSSFMPR
ncbi:MAG: hypothetical protein ACXVZO_05220 [Gaiellaceae bacterium]